MEIESAIKLLRETDCLEDKNTKDILKGKNYEKIFDEILSNCSFEPDDLKIFDDYINCEKIKDNNLKEKYFEAFLKISGIEKLMNEETKRLLIRSKSSSDNSFDLANPLLFSNINYINFKNNLDRASSKVNGIGIFDRKNINKFCNKDVEAGSNCSTDVKLRETKIPIFLSEKSNIPFQKYKIYDFAKKIPFNSDSRISILAYLICIERDNFYNGEYEIYYLIDYLLKENGKNGYEPEASNSISNNENLSNNILNRKYIDTTHNHHDNFSEDKSKSELPSKNIQKDEDFTPTKIQRDSISADINSKFNDEYRNTTILDSCIESCHHEVINKDKKCNSMNIEQFKNPRSLILVNWSNNFIKKLSDSSIVTFSIEEFLNKEVMFLNDFDSLISIIKIKKSHEILYLRLRFILSHLNEIQSTSIINTRNLERLENLNENDTIPCIEDINAQKNNFNFLIKWIKTAIHKVFKFSKNSQIVPDLSTKEEVSQNTKLLSSIIIDSYKEYTPYTECILLDLNSEYITNYLIYKTKACLPCFFTICKTVNPLYIECFNICIEKLELMSDEQLLNVIKCPLFKVNTFEGFKTIVLRMKNMNNEAFFISLLSKIKDIKIMKELELGEMEAFSWKNELLKRINFIADFIENKSLLLPFAKHAISPNNIGQSVSMMFKLQNYHLFKTGIKYLMVNHDELLASINVELLKREYSVFYYKVVKLLITYGFLRSLEFLDSSLYSEAIKLKLLKSEKIRNKLQNCEILKIYNNDKSANFKISKGLFFNNSFLKIHSPYKKFVIAIEFIVYKECLEDTELLNLGKNLSLVLEDGDIKIVQNGFSRKLASLNTIVNQKFYNKDDNYKLDIASDDFEKCVDNQLNIKKSIKIEDQKKEAISLIEASNLISTLSTINLSLFINQNSAMKLTPISLKFTIINTGKFLTVEMLGFESQDILNYQIDSIFISEKFNGILKSFLYSETNEILPQFPSKIQIKSETGQALKNNLFANAIKFYNLIIRPMDKLLDYKGRKGFYIDRKGIFRLGKTQNKKFIAKKNILEI